MKNIYLADKEYRYILGKVFPQLTPLLLFKPSEKVTIPEAHISIFKI